MKTRTFLCVILLVAAANAWAGLDVVLDSGLENPLLDGGAKQPGVTNWWDAEANVFQEDETSNKEELGLGVSLLPKQKRDNPFHTIQVSFLIDVNPGFTTDINLEYFTEKPQPKRIGTVENANSGTINSIDSTDKRKTDPAESFSTVTDCYTVSDPLHLLFDKFASNDWWDAAAHVYAKGGSSETDSYVAYEENMDSDISFLLRHKSDKPFGETDGDDPGLGAFEFANSDATNPYESTDMGVPEREGSFSTGTGNPLWKQTIKAAHTGQVLSDKINVTLVPEPATLALFGLGTIVALRRRRK